MTTNNDLAAKAAERIRTEDYRSIEPLILDTYAPAMAVVEAARAMRKAETMSQLATTRQELYVALDKLDAAGGE